MLWPIHVGSHLDFQPESPARSTRGSGTPAAVAAGFGGAGSPVRRGGVGLVIAIVYVLLGGDPAALIGTGGGANDAVYANGSPLAAECQTGADANTKEDCRIVAYVNSVQAYWKSEFEASGDTYEPARTTFQRQSDTGCGTALSGGRTRSTARMTSSCTSTSDSSTTCVPSSGRRADRLPRATSSPTNTGTTSRTCWACSTADRVHRG